MAAELVVFLASVALLLAVPVELALWSDVCLYASLLWYQACFTSTTATSLVVGGSYAILSFLYYLMGWKDILPLVGTTIYAALSLRHAIGALAERGVPGGYRTSPHLAALFMGAFGLSILLRPDPSYIWAPIALILGGMAVQGLMAAKQDRNRKADGADPHRLLPEPGRTTLSEE